MIIVSQLPIPRSPPSILSAWFPDETRIDHRDDESRDSSLANLVHHRPSCDEIRIGHQCLGSCRYVVTWLRIILFVGFGVNHLFHLSIKRFEFADSCFSVVTMIHGLTIGSKDGVFAIVLDDFATKGNCDVELFGVFGGAMF